MKPKQIFNPIKIIHTSDLHLGSDGFKSSVQGQSIPIKQVVDTTLNEKADVLVIAGDLVDHNRVHLEVILELQNQLNRLRIPIILLPGNHDSLDEDSIYNRAQLVENCPYLRMFSNSNGEIIHLKNLHLSFWGKPTIHHSPQFLPLGNAPKRNQEKWFLGVAHGLITEESNNEQRSSPIFRSHIAQSDFDYIALGHIDVFRDVSEGNVPAFYSGSPEGTTPEHPGVVALIELDDHKGVTVKPITVEINLPK